MSNSIAHTLNHLEEQQKQRLIKSKMTKKESQNEEEMLKKNECECSIDNQYDNFDGVEDELDLKVRISIFQLEMKFSLLLSNKFIRAINLITKIKLRYYILFIVNILYLLKKDVSILIQEPSSVKTDIFNHHQLKTDVFN